MPELLNAVEAEPAAVPKERQASSSDIIYALIYAHNACARAGGELKRASDNLASARIAAKEVFRSNGWPASVRTSNAVVRCLDADHDRDEPGFDPVLVVDSFDLIPSVFELKDLPAEGGAE